MRKMKRIPFALLLVGVLTVTVTSSALALGNHTQPCTVLYSFAGSSNSSEVKTFQTTSGGCGNVGARARYKTYEASPVYLSAWKWAGLTVTTSPGGSNIIVGGEHQVTNPGWAYSGSFTT